MRLIFITDIILLTEPLSEAERNSLIIYNLHLYLFLRLA